MENQNNVGDNNGRKKKKKKKSEKILYLDNLKSLSKPGDTRSSIVA